MQGWRNYAAVRSAALYMRYGDWAPGAGGDPIHSEHPALPQACTRIMGRAKVSGPKLSLFTWLFRGIFSLASFSGDSSRSLRELARPP